MLGKSIVLVGASVQYADGQLQGRRWELWTARVYDT
jgi:hypothetical protein